MLASVTSPAACTEQLSHKCRGCLQVYHEVQPFGKDNTCITYPVAPKKGKLCCKEKTISGVFLTLGAVKVQYCSRQCQELAWAEHHREECDQVRVHQR